MAEAAATIAVDDKTAAKTARSKPTKALPTNRIKFNKQLDVLRAYVAASKEGAKSVTNKEVGDIAGMVETTVSLANAFFGALGWLRRSEGGFLPSEEAILFKRAYDWKPEGAERKLAPSLRQSWFGEALLPKLEFGPISEDDALARLAEVASASPEYKGQLAMLLDYLQIAGIVERDAGMIKLAKPGPGEEVPSTQQREEASVLVTPVVKGGVDTKFSKSDKHLVEFQISVTVDSAEMGEWGPERIAAFFHGIAEVITAKTGLEKGATRN